MLLYSYGKPYLYKKDKGFWIEIKSEQLMAEDSGKTIEFYVPKQLLNNPESITIKAKTFYQNQCVLKPCSETLADTFPNKIELTDLQKPLISLQTEKTQYKTVFDESHSIEAIQSFMKTLTSRTKN